MTLVTATVELSIAGVWTDVTDYALLDQGIDIRHGASSESGVADPSECTLSLKNTDGRFTPDNPAGPYYGNIGRNTPLRVTVGGAVRFVGEVSEFPSEWDPSESLVVTRVVASGPLRRLAKGISTSSIVRDVMVARSDIVGSIAAYWPLEDGIGATQFASAIGGPPLTLARSAAPTPQGYDPADALLASAPIATFDTSAVVGTVPDYTFTGSATYGFLLHVPEAGTTNSPALISVSGSGTAYRWYLQRIADSVVGFEGLLRLKAAGESGGAPAEILNASLFTFPPGSTHYIYLELTNNGADVDWFVTALGLGSQSGTLAGYNVGQATSVFVGGDSNSPESFDAEDGIAIGHVIIGKTDSTLDGSSTLEEPLLGYTTNPAYINADGESVTDRMVRLAGVAGVDIVTVDGSVADVHTLGMDTPGGIVDRMRRAEAADVGGILHDDIDALGLRYVTRTALYSDTQLAGALELDYAAGDISPPLRPTDDDFALINDSTVTAENGGTGRAFVASGPLSVEAYPDGVGRYEDSRTLALAYGEDPAEYAAWIVNVGTVAGQRFTAVTVDLRANPALAAAVTAIRPGNWIRLVNLPAWLPPVDPELVVRGWSETVHPAVHKVTFNCAPADPYRVTELDDTTDSYGRLDSETTVTNEALDTTETGVDYTGDTWITTADRPGDFPFDVVIGGEVMTVTSAVAGTFTVTRSVNGVVKSHAISAPIRLHNPARLAL